MAQFSDDLYSVNPSAVSCDTANQIMKGGLRSVIMSKLAFNTFNHFNSADAASVNPIDLPSSIDLSVVDLLEDELTRGEVPFTTAFCKDSTIKKLASNLGLTAHGEWKFSHTRMDDRQTRPRSAIVFVRNETAHHVDEETTERTPVALLEVGVANGKGSSASDDKWLEKFGQGTKYIDLMNNDDVAGQKRKLEEIKDSQESFVGSQGTESDQQQDPKPTQLFGKLKMSDPILFYVIAFGNEPDEEEEVQCMKIGCFISQKRAGDRKSSTTRLALLYRKHVQGSDAIGNALCTMLKQIYWFSEQVKNYDQGHWKYLGPHCALVPAPQGKDGKEVYRAYDSRPWHIARSSMIYDSKIAAALFVEGARVVYDASDQEAGTVVQEQSGYRLFDFRGNMKVIAVPFIEGSHQPQNKAQLLGVAEFLKRMHDNGLVHGDIRLLNIVFTENPEDSQLIDFDFGGKADNDSLVYPPGYRRALDDGLRIGVPGKGIRKWHDVYALYNAFDKVLVAGMKWTSFKMTEEPSIDKLITLLEGLELNDGFMFGMHSNLVSLLTKNTKLGSHSQQTREAG